MWNYSRQTGSDLERNHWIGFDEDRPDDYFGCGKLPRKVPENKENMTWSKAGKVKF